MNNFTKSFIDRQASERTKESYSLALNAFLVFFNEVFPETGNWVDDYQKHLLSRGLSNRTVNWHLTIIKSFYKKALKKTIFFDRLKVTPPPISPPSPADLAKLFEAANKKFEAVFRFMVDTGIRVDELKWLSEQPFSTLPKEFVILGKGKKQRVVVPSPATLALLRTPLLFLSPVTIRQVQYQLRRLSKQLNIPHIHPHQLRHFFATNALNNGVNILEIKEMLGHSFLQTTEVYTHVTQGRLRSVWEKYHKPTL